MELQSLLSNFNSPKEGLEYLKDRTNNNVNWENLSKASEEIAKNQGGDKDSIALQIIGQYSQGENPLFNFEELKAPPAIQGKDLQKYDTNITSLEGIKNLGLDVIDTLGLTGFSENASKRRQDTMRYLQQSAKDNIPYDNLDEQSYWALSGMKGSALSRHEYENLKKTQELISKTENDLTQDDKNFINKQLNPISHFFSDYTKEDFEEFKDKATQDLINADVQSKLNFLNTIHQEKSITSILTGSDEKTKNDYLQAVQTIAKEAGFEGIAYDKKGDVFFYDHENFYKPNQDFFGNFLNILASNAGSIGGGITGAIVGAKNAKNPQQALIGSVVGAGIGSFIGASSDVLLTNARLNRENTLKEVLAHSLEEGTLSVVGDLAIMGGAMAVKNGLKILKDSNVAQKTSETFKNIVEYTPIIGFVSRFQDGNAKSALKLVSNTIDETQQKALHDFGESFGGNIKFGSQDNFRAYENIKAKFGENHFITKGAKIINDAFMLKSQSQAQKTILQAIRADESGNLVAFLSEAANASPTLQNSLKSLLNQTTFNLKKQLQYLDLKPNEVKEIFDTFQKGTKTEYAQAIDEVLTKVYDDTYKVQIDPSKYNNFRIQLEQSGVLPEDSRRFLEFAQKNIYNQQGVSFTQLNNALKQINSYYKTATDPNFKDFTAKALENFLRDDIKQGIDSIFAQNKTLYKDAQSLFSSALSDYGKMKATLKLVDKIKLRDESISYEQAFKNLYEYVKGQGGELQNLTKLTQHLDKNSAQRVELSILYNLFNQNIKDFKDIQVFDSQAFFKNLESIKDHFNTQSAKDFIDIAKGFDTLFKNDVLIANAIRNATTDKISSSIATTIQGAVKFQLVRMMFENIVRLLPNIPFMSSLNEKVQGASLRFHIKSALNKNLDVQDFKISLSNKAKYNKEFNSQTKQALENIIGKIDKAQDEMLEVAQRNTKQAQNAKDLQEYQTLQKYGVESLQKLSQDDFNHFVDSVLSGDIEALKSAPNIVYIADLNADLAKELGLNNGKIFLRKNDLHHSRNERKGTYNQHLDKDEIKQLPKTITENKNIYVDKVHNNFFITKELNENEIAMFVANKDELGNYVIHIKRVLKSDLNKSEYSKVGSGIEPHIERSTNITPPSHLGHLPPNSDLPELPIIAKPELPAKALNSEANLSAIIPQTTQDIKFIDTKGKEHTLTKEVQEQWLKTFNLKSLDESYTPQLPQELQEAIGKEIKLTKGSLYKVIEKGREQYIPQIKETLEKPDFALRDTDNMLIIAKEIGDKQYFTSINLETKDYFISVSNAPKKENILKNKVENGAEVVYQSPNAKSIFYTDTLLQEGKSPTNKIDKEHSTTKNTNPTQNTPMIHTKEAIKQYLQGFSKHLSNQSKQQIPSVLKEIDSFTNANDIVQYTGAFKKEIQQFIPYLETKEKLEQVLQTPKLQRDPKENLEVSITRIDEKPSKIHLAFDEKGYIPYDTHIAEEFLKQPTTNKDTSTLIDTFIKGAYKKAQKDLSDTYLLDFTGSKIDFGEDITLLNGRELYYKDKQINNEYASPSVLINTAKKLKEGLSDSDLYLAHANKDNLANYHYPYNLLNEYLEDISLLSDWGLADLLVDKSIKQPFNQALDKAFKANGEPFGVLWNNEATKKNLEQNLADYGISINPKDFFVGKNAIDFLLDKQSGYIQSAFHKEGLGDIDLVWGDSSFGLKHILDKHGSEFKDIAKELDEIIQNGEVVKRQGRDEAYNIEYKGFKVGINKGFNKQGENKWIVTAFDDNIEKTAKTAPANDSTKGASLPLNSKEDSSTKNTKYTIRGLKIPSDEELKQITQAYTQDNELFKQRKEIIQSYSNKIEKTKSKKIKQRLEDEWLEKLGQINRKIDDDYALFLRKNGVDTKAMDIKRELERSERYAKPLFDLLEGFSDKELREYKVRYKNIDAYRDSYLEVGDKRWTEGKGLRISTLQNILLTKLNMSEYPKEIQYAYFDSPLFYHARWNEIETKPDSELIYLGGLSFDEMAMNRERKDLEYLFDIKPIKEFGTNYAEFYKDGKGAIQKLLSEAKDYETRKEAGSLTEDEVKQGAYKGQVAGAFHKEGLGDIDLVWGDSKMGLAHILERRAEQWGEEKALRFVRALPNMIQEASILKGRDNTIELITPRSTIILAKKDDNHFMITAFRDSGNKKKFEMLDNNQTFHDESFTSKSDFERSGTNILLQNQQNKSENPHAQNFDQATNSKELESGNNLSLMDSAPNPTTKDTIKQAKEQGLSQVQSNTNAQQLTLHDIQERLTARKKELEQQSKDLSTELKTQEKQANRVAPILKELLQKWRALNPLIIEWKERKEIRGKFGQFLGYEKKLSKRKPNLSNLEHIEKTLEAYKSYAKNNEDSAESVKKEISLLEDYVEKLKNKQNKQNIQNLIEHSQSKEQILSDERRKINTYHDLRQNFNKGHHTDLQILEGNNIPQEQHKQLLEFISQTRSYIESNFNINPLKEFGTNYAEFYKDGKGAIQKLLAERQGQVAGAFYKEGLGDIDLVWGDSKMGLQKIITKHIDDFNDFAGETQQAKLANGLSEIVENGKVVSENGVNTIWYKRGDDYYKVGLSKGFNGQGENQWVITAYKKDNITNVDSEIINKLFGGDTGSLSVPNKIKETRTLVSNHQDNLSTKDLIKEAKEQDLSVKETKEAMQDSTQATQDLTHLKQKLENASDEEKGEIIKEAITEQNNKLLEEITKLQNVLEKKDFLPFEIDEKIKWLSTKSQFIGEDEESLKKVAISQLEFETKDKIKELQKVLKDNKIGLGTLKEFLTKAKDPKIIENKTAYESVKATLKRLIEKNQKRVLKILDNAIQERKLTYYLNTKDGEERGRKLFYSFKPDTEQIELFEKIFPIAQKLGVEVKQAINNEFLSKEADGVYYTQGNSLRVKNNRIYQEKGKVFLHELIHSVTSRAMIAYESGKRELLSPNQIVAINNIQKLYKEVYKNHKELGFETFESFFTGSKGDYGLKNSHEFVAELSNPIFREKLKKVGVFEKLVDNILRLFVSAKEALGLAKTNAYDSLKRSLYGIIDNYKDDFTANYEKQGIKELDIKQSKKLEKAFLDSDNINIEALEAEAVKLPKVLSFREFKEQFRTDAKGNAKVNTLIGEIKINVPKAYNHFVKNTYNVDRKEFSGAFLDTLVNPLFIVRQKYRPKVSLQGKSLQRSNNSLDSKMQNKSRIQIGDKEIIQDSYVFYKPFVNENGLVSLASFAISQNGELLHKTFYDIKTLSKLKKLIKGDDEDLLYFKNEKRKEYKV